MADNESYIELQHNKTVKVLFLILFGAVIAGLVFIFRYYFWPFLFAVILYMALRPVYDLILRLVRKKGIGASIMILVLIVAILVPVFLLILSIIDQVIQLYNIIQEQIKAGIINDIYKSAYVDKIIAYLNIDHKEITSKVTDIVKSASGMALDSAQKIISYPLNFILNFFFLLLMLFFMFMDGDKMAAVIYRALPFPRDLERNVIDRLKEVVRILLTGNLLIMILQGLFVGLGLFIADLPVALLGGSMAGLLSLIPVVGTSLVWAPAVIYLAVTGSYLMSLFLGLWCLIWYLLLENLLKPKLFGKKLNFHPVVFFFLLLGSIQTFGIPGVFIGPLLLTLFYSLWEIYKVMKEYDKHRCENRPEGEGTRGRDPGITI